VGVWAVAAYGVVGKAFSSDAEAEAAETQVHIEIAFRHGYVDQEVFTELDDAYDKILGQIIRMIDQADRWLVKREGNAARE
jgi:hypothetical protein